MLRSHRIASFKVLKSTSRLWRNELTPHCRTLILSGTKSNFAEAENQTTDPCAAARPFNEVPRPKGFLHRIPFIGTLLHFKPFTDVPLGDVSLLSERLYQQYGPIVRVTLTCDTILVFNPDDFLTVSRHEGKMPTRITIDLLDILHRRTGVEQDLANRNGEDWAKLRSPLNKHLARVDSATYYLPAQNEVAKDFIKSLTDDQLTPEQMEDYFFRYSAEAIGVVCFNKRLGLLDPVLKNEPDNVSFIESTKAFFKHLSDSLTGKSLAHGLYRNKTYRGFEKASETTHRLVDKFVEETKEKIEVAKKSGTFDDDERNLLNSLLLDNSIGLAMVKKIITSLLVTGTDSTAKNLQSVMYQLGTNPEKQEKLREEVKSVVGPDGVIDATALNKMVYLTACIKETFRIRHPFLLGVSRRLAEDAVLAGYHVPKGTFVICGNHVASKQVDNPNTFHPERWLRDPTGKTAEDIHRMTLQPFGVGARNCIGKRFAEQEIRSAIANVVLACHIEVAPSSHNMKFNYKQLFVQPDRPIEFIFTRIERSEAAPTSM